jgi:hypothetical protein
MGSRRLTPSELGINGVNLKTDTNYTSNNLDVRDAFVYTVIIDVTETGSPTAGEFSLTIRATDEDGTAIYELDAVTAITSQTNGGQTVFTWGSGNAATLNGNGTIASNVDILKVFEYMEIELDVTTVNDGTTSTAAVTLLLEEVWWVEISLSRTRAHLYSTRLKPMEYTPLRFRLQPPWQQATRLLCPWMMEQQVSSFRQTARGSFRGRIVQPHSSLHTTTGVRSLLLVVFLWRLR